MVTFTFIVDFCRAFPLANHREQQGVKLTTERLLLSSSKIIFQLTRLSVHMSVHITVKQAGRNILTSFVLKEKRC